jgi:hypothetical protein
MTIRPSGSGGDNTKEAEIVCTTLHNNYVSFVFLFTTIVYVFHQDLQPPIHALWNFVLKENIPLNNIQPYSTLATAPSEHKKKPENILEPKETL